MSSCLIKYSSKFYALILIAAVFVVLFYFSPSLAGSKVIIDADKQYEYAQYCYSIGEYSRAVDEYRRFIYFFPQDEKLEAAMHGIGMSYFGGRHFEKAVKAFEEIVDACGDAGLDIGLCIDSYFMISKCYVKLNNALPAITNLYNLVALTDDIDVKDEAYYKIGWIFLETGSWEKAVSNFGKISRQNRDKYRVQRLSDELDKEGLMPKKDPKTAGILSVIPGAGYLYCERYRDASVAFLLNAGLMFAAYEAFDDDNPAIGGVIGFVGLGFYAGNIYGSVTSARKYNRIKAKSFIDRLRENLKIGVSSEDNAAVSVAFVKSFLY